jgi:uncharacterized protein with PIN domain
MKHEFIADVHLGKLSRQLRMLGFDTLYNNQLTTTQIITIALQQNRMLLTRNSGMKQHAALQSFIITRENSYAQLDEVIQNLSLEKELHPFTICMVCNGMLEQVSKENIISQLQHKTILYFNKFWQCSNCKHVYWKGSHYEHMKQRLAKYQGVFH